MHLINLHALFSALRFLKAVAAWGLICISGACPARGKMLAFEINMTVNAALSQSFGKQSGSRSPHQISFLPVFPVEKTY